MGRKQFKEDWLQKQVTEENSSTEGKEDWHVTKCGCNKITCWSRYTYTFKQLKTLLVSMLTILVSLQLIVYMAEVFECNLPVTWNDNKCDSGTQWSRIPTGLLNNKIILLLPRILHNYLLPSDVYFRVWEYTLASYSLIWMYLLFRLKLNV